jgi:hypothetical protein
MSTEGSSRIAWRTLGNELSGTKCGSERGVRLVWRAQGLGPVRDGEGMSNVVVTQRRRETGRGSPREPTPLFRVDGLWKTLWTIPRRTGVKRLEATPAMAHRDRSSA